jgi:hypothetical protein
MLTYNNTGSTKHVALSPPYDGLLGSAAAVTTASTNETIADDCSAECGYASPKADGTKSNRQSLWAISNANDTTDARTKQ